MQEVRDKVIRLEERQNEMRSDLKEHIEREEMDRDRLLSKLDKMEQMQSKQKGFIAGVSAAVSALVIAGTMLINWLHKGG